MRFTESDAERVTSVIGNIARQLPMLDAKRAGMELCGAPRFSAFSAFWPNENTLSRLIEDLFDPTGSHGQGPLFLNKLLERLQLPPVGPFDPVKVRREVRTAMARRIDLVIDMPRALIGIESKPWASEQADQLKDYMKALETWSGSREAILIFLSERLPQTAESADDVTVMTFARSDTKPSLQVILEQCLDAIRAPRVRLHVEEFLAFIGAHFGGNDTLDDGSEAYVEAVSREFVETGNRRAIAAVLASRDELHRIVITEIGEYVLAELGPEFAGNPADLPECLSKRVDWRIRKLNWPDNLNLAIQAQGNGYSNVIFGVAAGLDTDQQVDAAGRVCAVRPQVGNAVCRIHGGRDSPWWAWYANPEMPNWDANFVTRLVLESPTGRVDAHKMVIEMGNKLKQLASSIDAALGLPVASEGLK